MAKLWQLEDGIKLVRAIHATTKQFGYHLALGGSVLNFGESKKDLDLYFLPLCNPKFPEDSKSLIAWLTSMWGEPDPIGNYEDPPDLQVNLIPPGPEGVLPGRQYQVNEDRLIQWGAQIEPEPPEPPRLPGRNRDLGAEDNWMRALLDVEKPKAKLVESNSTYKFKLTYTRAGDDRIDVFIL